MVILRSSLKPELLRKTLFKGTAYAACGLLVLTLPHFWKVLFLKNLGMPLFICGILLIGWGLRPYKKLKSLELRPHTLEATPSALIFSQKGIPLFKIPCTDIKKISWVEREYDYGILIQTSDRPAFFPYFSKYACKELQACLDEVVHFDKADHSLTL